VSGDRRPQRKDDLGHQQRRPIPSDVTVWYKSDGRNAMIADDSDGRGYQGQHGDADRAHEHLGRTRGQRRTVRASQTADGVFEVRDDPRHPRMTMTNRHHGRAAN